MIDLLIITSIAAFMIYLVYLFIKKDYYSYINYIVVGIYIPLILYFCNWSDIINKDYSDGFVIIFIYFNIIFILFTILNFNKNYSKIKIKKYFIKRKILLYIVNISYIFILLFENYLLSGHIFPLIKGIDIHTKNFSATTALLITKNTIPIILINILFYLKNIKKKTFLLFSIILILIPILTKGARHNSLQEIFILSLFLYPLLKDNLYLLIKKNLKYILIIFIAIGGMSTYRTQKVSNLPENYGVYKDWIGYTGPLKNTQIIPTYYGYYPMSLNNLNLSILKNNNEFEVNVLGLNSYRGFYSVLNKLFGRDPYSNGEYRVYAVPAATVPTGFFDFYSDYKEYVFFPILFSFFISQFLAEIFIRRKDVLILGIYNIFNMGWLDMMFLNSLFRDVLVPSILLYILYLKIFIKIDKEDVF